VISPYKVKEIGIVDNILKNLTNSNL